METFNEMVDRVANELYPLDTWKEGKVAQHIINLKCQKAFKDGVKWYKEQLISELAKIIEDYD